MKGLTILLFAFTIFLSSCASNSAKVDVSVFKLKSTRIESRESPIVRAEQKRRLKGVLSNVERTEKMGEYYTVDWRVDSELKNGPVRVVFTYRQAGSASKILQLEKEYPAGKSKGRAEFMIVGKEFQQQGRVLNWRSDLYVNSSLVAYDQSYMWK